MRGRTEASRQHGADGRVAFPGTWERERYQHWKDTFFKDPHLGLKTRLYPGLPTNEML